MPKVKHPATLICNGRIIASGVSFTAALKLANATNIKGAARRRVNFYKGTPFIFENDGDSYAIVNLNKEATYLEPVYTFKGKLYRYSSQSASGLENTAWYAMHPIEHGNQYSDADKDLAKWHATRFMVAVWHGRLDLARTELDAIGAIAKEDTSDLTYTSVAAMRLSRYRLPIAV